MQKWEYTRIVCAQDQVISVDGQKLPGKQMSLWRQDRSYPLVGDYIQRMGQEGWELVGMTTHTPDEGPGDCLMVFKRPIEEHTVERYAERQMI